MAGANDTLVEESGQPSRKRARKNEPQAPQQHESLWFDDGNIVLIADDTSFRVHKSVLANNSAVFKDLLDIPQPRVVQDIDGFPVVHISDTAEDLAILLDVIYYGLR